MNMGRILRQLRYFFSVLQIQSKLDKELRREIEDFRKRTPRGIHIIKNHSIWIKIRREIKEQKLWRKTECEERENKKFI